MMEIVGGIVAIVVGVIMLIIGGAVLNAVTVGDGIGNCDAQDYNCLLYTSPSPRDS